MLLKEGSVREVKVLEKKWKEGQSNQQVDESDEEEDGNNFIIRAFNSF